jgi:quinol monooxygenase YgiN
MVSAQVDRGCGHVELTRDADDASVLIYVEDWENREQLELRFVSEVQGLDYVASVRQVQ